MTARQLRRAQQKAERKAAKKLTPPQPEVSDAASCSSEPAQSPEHSDSCAKDRTNSCPEGRSDSCPKSISEAKLAANQRNAQLSTGPVSSAGKAISSQNRTRHGLSGSTFRVMPDESQTEFDQLVASMLRDEEAANQEEIEMVRQMAEALWQSRRAVRLQNDCLAAALESSHPVAKQAAHKELALFLRYQTAHDRTFFRYSAEMRKRRNERRRVERGFESQKLRAAQETRKQEAHQIRQAIDKRKQERHEMSFRLAHAKLEHKQQHKTAPEPVFQTTPANEIPGSFCAGAAF